MASFFTGNSGSSTGEHLDFRVYDPRKKSYVDPTRFQSYMQVGGKSLADQYSVTSNYGMRDHPTKGGRKMHHGIDYGTPTDTEVTITGGKYLTTWDDKGGGGITNQYGITDENGDAYEILLMHGSNKNKILSDSAVTNGQPLGASTDTGANPGDTPSPASTAKERAKNYSEMSKSEMNAAYDAMRSDPNKASQEGLAMHKAHFNKE